MKNIANYITLSRIIFSFTLVLFEPLSFWFSMLYVLIGLTDVIDGYIARKTNTTSELGARLDSIADLVMIVIVLYVFFPILKLMTFIYAWIVMIIMIRVLSMLIVYIKFKTFAILHTFGNKATGLLLFVTPVLLIYIEVNIMASILCVVGTLSAIEEVIIHITEKSLDINQKSLLVRSK